VPLVVFDALFDERLFRDTGIAFIPRPEDLTPAGLQQVLAGLQDPAEFQHVLDVGHWRREFEMCLADGSDAALHGQAGEDQ
jgi:hypothetical protein